MREWLPSNRVSLSLVLLALLLAVSPASRVAAHDEDGGAAITLRAPLDAVDCAATPPTITVLGLTIDVSTATFDGGGGDGEDGRHAVSSQSHDGEDGDGNGDDGGNGASSCATLTVGQSVRVAFASDATPLVATSVTHCDGNGGVEITGPLQAVDTTMLTVTLLGLTVDASTATIAGNDGEGDTVPADLTSATPGQHAEVRLDPTKLPTLVATEIEIRIDTVPFLQAPLDAVDCTATPPTITVLGLTIDISTATIHAGDQGGDALVMRESGNDQGDDDQGDDDQGDDDGGEHGCAGLVPGTMVRVVLAGDAPPLVATQVKEVEGDEQGVEVRGPIQAADGSAMTVSLLGLVVDVSGAGLDGGAPPVDFTKVVVGQVAEAHLDTSKLPALVAITLEVTDVGSDVDVEVDDAKGVEIHDASDDLSVDVTETVTTRHGGKRTRTIVHVHTTARGSFHLSGLPAGSAKITVTRAHGGVTTGRSKSARLKQNRTQSLRLRLKRTH